MPPGEAGGRLGEAPSKTGGLGAVPPSEVGVVLEVGAPQRSRGPGGAVSLSEVGGPGDGGPLDVR